MNAQAPKRPRPQRLGDRLIGGNATKEQIACDHAVMPFDRMAIAMDDKWGIDRLPALVSPETAARYGSALGKLNDAIAAANPAEVAARAAVCVRGMQAMDAEAEAAGAPKSPPEIIEFEHDGKRIGIMTDTAWWPALKAQRPDLTFYTLGDVGVALAFMQDHNPVIAEAKKHFPKAQVTAIRPTSQLARDLDDEIPF